MPGIELTFVSAADPKTSATAIGGALGLEFTERDSLWLGGDYLLSEPSWGEIIVQHNDDLGEPAEPTHPDAPCVVRIDTDTAHAPLIVATLRRLGLTQVES